jgi:hypothetical protein
LKPISSTIMKLRILEGIRVLKGQCVLLRGFYPLSSCAPHPLSTGFSLPGRDESTEGGAVRYGE